MERLLKGTAAYKILAGDSAKKRLSHAYLLLFSDGVNLRAALKLFAAELFGARRGTPLYDRIMNESYSDLKIYPDEGKKIAVEGIGDIIEDAALKPTEGDKKLYVLCDFDSASTLVQNKLLKSLEEPTEGIYFLLGATTAAPICDTVLSRVKKLEIAPFSESDIFDALERAGNNPLNGEAATAADGCLGTAQSIVFGGWFKEVKETATKACSATSVDAIARICAECGETKYKKELLAEMQRQYFSALTAGGDLAKKLAEPALTYALEKLNGANADLKFNAHFAALMYDFLLGVAKENEKWRKFYR